MREGAVPAVCGWLDEWRGGSIDCIPEQGDGHMHIQDDDQDNGDGLGGAWHNPSSVPSHIQDDMEREQTMGS